jgi:hypothetical protein
MNHVVFGVCYWHGELEKNEEESFTYQVIQSNEKVNRKASVFTTYQNAGDQRREDGPNSESV